MKKLWGGRFQAQTDGQMEQLNASISFDQRLYKADIRGSQAYARALAAAGILSEHECEQIVTGLAQVLDEFRAGTFGLVPGDEDIHTAVERRLGERIGPIAGKLHTGRANSIVAQESFRNEKTSIDDSSCRGNNCTCFGLCGCCGYQR